MTTDPRATQPIDVRAVCRKIAEEKLPCNCGAFESIGKHHCECVGYYHEGLIDAFAAHFGPLVEAAPKLMKALEAELTGPPKNVPKSSWAKEWDDTDAALAKLREVNE